MYTLTSDERRPARRPGDAMKFTCERCQKPYSTADDPVPGRLYRIPCRCGNTIVLQVDAVDSGPAATRRRRGEEPRLRTVPPPLPAPARAGQADPAAPALAPEVVEEEAASLADGTLEFERPDVRVLIAGMTEPVTPTEPEVRAPRVPSLASSPRTEAEVARAVAAAARGARTRGLAFGAAVGAAAGAACAAIVTAVVLTRAGAAPATAPAPAAPPPEVQAVAPRDPAPAAPPAVPAATPAAARAPASSAGAVRRTPRDRDAAGAAPFLEPATRERPEPLVEPTAEPDEPAAAATTSSELPSPAEAVDERAEPPPAEPAPGAGASGDSAAGVTGSPRDP